MENIPNFANKELKNQDNIDNLLLFLNQRENIEKIEREHKEVIEFINNVSNITNKEILVPVCDEYAYFVGKIKSPNECRVYLGEDYFLKTTNNRALEILTRRLNKTKEILGNLNTEISKEKSVEVQILNKGNTQNLKQLNDDTFEIVENVTEKEIHDLNNRKVTEQKKIQESERIKMINEKLKKLKDFKKEHNVEPIVLSVVKCEKKHFNNQSEINKQTSESIQIKNESPSNNKTKKKKDTIDSNVSQINPFISSSAYSNSEYPKAKDDVKPTRSYFFTEDDDEI